jgi:hypothetical protein
MWEFRSFEKSNTTHLGNERKTLHIFSQGSFESNRELNRVHLKIQSNFTEEFVRQKHLKIRLEK